MEFRKGLSLAERFYLTTKLSKLNFVVKLN